MITNLNPHPAKFLKASLPVLLLWTLLGKNLNIVEDHLASASHCRDHVALVQLRCDLTLLVLGVGGEQVLAGLVVHHVRSIQLGNCLLYTSPSPRDS